jgi:hypothetical protein
MKHLRQSWLLLGSFIFLNPLQSSKSSEELEESSLEEGAGYDEKQASDGSESEASHPPEILSQRGHAVRHNLLSCLLLI